jgi:hypothetical protein
MTGLSLGDLFDLEILVRREKQEGEEIRRSRYRQLGRRLLDQGVAPADSGALLKGVLGLGAPVRSPGSGFEAALRWLHTMLAAGGAAFGAFLSLGLLHFAGEHPVNLLSVLAALVGTQLALLAFLLIALIPRNRKPVPGPIQEFLLGGLRRLAVRLLPEADPGLLKDTVDRLDAHRGLTRWLLLRAAQVFGVSFNLAALAGCFYRIVFSDVAFGWSTTLHLNASGFHSVAEALSLPWSWLFPKGVPSLTLVEMTQYSHLEGKYLLRAAGERSADPSLVGGWWPFLLLSIGTYGLLPRLIVLAASGFRVRRILGETPEANEEFRRLAEWMKLPVVTTQAEGSAPPPLAIPADGSSMEPALPPPGSRCIVLLDPSPALTRDALASLVQGRFGWTVADVLTTGDPSGIRESTEGPLLLVFSAWEEPTKGNQRRLEALPKDRLTVVGLLKTDAGGGDEARLARIRDRWKRKLRSLPGDRKLRVESLGARS